MPSKQCDHLQILKKERKEENPNVSFIIFFYHAESAINHQQREPVIKMIGAHCTDSSPTSPFNLKGSTLQRFFKYAHN